MSERKPRGNGDDERDEEVDTRSTGPEGTDVDVALRGTPEEERIPEEARREPNEDETPGTVPGQR